MKPKVTIPKVKLTFGVLSILFLATQLYLYAACTSSAYTLQIHKKKHALLKKEEQQLHIQLADAQNLETIKKYAKEKLHMQQIPLEKIRKLTLKGEL